MEAQQVRPTKKQQELLAFIQAFIVQHGYGPSYREIMVGCNYSSVATVALHVTNLIKRGHLRKNGRSARSLEVIDAPQQPDKLQTNTLTPAEEKWLVEKIDYKFTELEASTQVTQGSLDDLYVLVGSLKVLGFDGAASSFTKRLIELKKRVV